MPGAGRAARRHGPRSGRALSRRPRTSSPPSTTRSAWRSRGSCGKGPKSELTLTHNTQPAILAHSVAVWAVVDGPRCGTVGAGGGSQPRRVQRPRRGRHAQPSPTAARPRAPARRADATPPVAARPARWPRCSASRPSRWTRRATRPPGRTASRWRPISTPPTRRSSRAIRRRSTRAGEGCKARGAKRVLPLKVSGAFHSPLMAPAVDGLHDALTEVRHSPIPPFPSSPTRAARPVRTGSRRQAAARRSAHRAGALGGVHAGERRRSRPAPRFIEIGPGQRAVGPAQADRARCANGDPGDGGRGGDVSRMRRRFAVGRRVIPSAARDRLPHSGTTHRTGTIGRSPSLRSG